MRGGGGEREAGGKSIWKRRERNVAWKVCLPCGPCPRPRPGHRALGASCGSCGLPLSPASGGCRRRRAASSRGRGTPWRTLLPITSPPCSSPLPAPAPRPLLRLDPALSGVSSGQAHADMLPGLAGAGAAAAAAAQGPPQTNGGSHGDVRGGWDAQRGCPRMVAAVPLSAFRPARRQHSPLCFLLFPPHPRAARAHSPWCLRKPCAELR